MTNRIRRKNQKLLDGLRAGSIAALTFAPLNAMNFKPAWGAALLGLIAGGLSAAAIDLGIVAAIAFLSIPIAAANPLLGVVFLIAGIAVTRYVGSDGSQAFLLVSVAIAGAFVGPVWTAAAIAGYLLGAGEGALVAAITCVAVEALGLLLGEPHLIGVFTGGSSAAAGGAQATQLLDFAATTVPKSLFAVQWVKDSFGEFGPDSLTQMKNAVSATTGVTALIAQPVIWACAAAVAGAFAKLARRRHAAWLSVAGVASGTAIAAILTALLVPSFGGDVPARDAIWGFFASLTLAVILVVLLDRVFTRQVIKKKTTRSSTSMAAEDADVDELLRLISTAEEKLATDHTTQKVVMITDMKSFSRMTEEDGSMLTAKAIQKHRDLLLPVVQRHGGHGKSTGGDGLVAAFDEPAEAMTAAAEMQQILHANNEAHPQDREMYIRIGIADGEIVLDKSGRPFLGAALNLAARVMNLADGGQAFATAQVADRAGDAVTTASHGDFELKNISKPVSVVEILWAPDQQPIDPRTRES